MPDDQKAARFNITLPAELRAAMEEAAGVNWSAIAAQAFKSHLQAIAAESEVETMDDVIARLKAADELDTNQITQEGKSVGARWAKESARPRQLRALQKWYEKCKSDTRAALQSYVNKEPGTIASHLFHTVYPMAGDSGISFSFWENNLGLISATALDDIDFAVGFIEGATEVWAQVKNQL